MVLCVAGLALEYWRWTTRRPGDRTTEILAVSAILASLAFNTLGMLFTQWRTVQRMLTRISGLFVATAFVLLAVTVIELVAGNVFR